LGGAVDLLLWGERWGAARAGAEGLVDEVVPWTERESGARRFVERVLDGRQESRRRGRVVWGPAEDEIVAKARARIGDLPSAYRPVYEQGLELLTIGAQQRGTYVEHQRRELERSAASALAPIGKAAYAFFYLRQMAAERAAGRWRSAEDEPVIDVDLGPRGSRFGQTLRARAFPGARFAAGEPAELRLVDAEHASEPSAAGGEHQRSSGRVAETTRDGARPREVAVRLALARGPAAAVEVYAPSFSAGGRLLELAIRDPAGPKPPSDRDETMRLARTLQRFGFEVARTTPGDTFVTTRLLTAFLLPLVRFLDAGGEAPVAFATLRDAGFVKSPRDLLGAFGTKS